MKFFKKFTSVFVVFVMLISNTYLLSFSLSETTEIPEGYTPIYTAEDLHNIRNDLAGKYILMNDIDLSAYENWEPVGTSEEPFTGDLNGNGHSISDMTIKGEYDREDELYFGLFGYSTGNLVTDLFVTDANIDIRYVDTEFSQEIRVGIIAGYAGGFETKNCVVTGNINVDGFTRGCIGGLFGKENMCEPLNCVNYADITVKLGEKNAVLDIGGITGLSPYDAINQCCNFGNITVSGTDIPDSYRKINIGGIMGTLGMYTVEIYDCYNRGNISVDFSAEDTYLGGIMGDAYAIERCYNTGDIIVPEDFAGCEGGISGSFSEAWIAIVPVSKIENVYYINESLYPSYIDGAYAPREHDITATLLSEEEFKNQASFTELDFENIWTMEENGYPVLRNQPQITLYETVDINTFRVHIVDKPISKWNSSNETIAVIINNEITALSPGNATVTAEHSYGYRTEYTVDVTSPAEPPAEEKCPFENLWIVRMLRQLQSRISEVIAYITELIKL